MNANDNAHDVGVARPWLGLSSFTEATSAYFFGREREVEELLERIHRHPLTVLFGLSGRGKTSLLGAGVLPRLRQSGARPLLIRLRPDGSSFVAQLRDAWDLATGERASTAGLWERGHRRVDRESLQTAPPVLILDQFEEVFTLGQRRSDELQALFDELACLVANRVPAELRERLAEDDAYAAQFDERATPARVVITLREDYLAQLEAWKGTLPALMRNRMALLPLDGPEALEAVLRPGAMGGQPLVDAPTAAAIVRFVAQRDADTPLQEIEAVPPLLSLLCFELNEARLAAGAAAITADQLEAEKANILQNFYERCFAGLPEAVREVVESPLLVSESGHRNACTEDDLLLALAAAGLERASADAALNALVDARLLTQERLAGSRRLELTHDLLTPLVVRARNERRARRQLELAEAERAAAEARNAGLQQERRRWQWAAAAMGGLLLAALAAGAYAYLAERRATATLAIARTTVDQVLTTLESPEMDEVHGFFRIENQLLDRLLPLARDLDAVQGEDHSPAGVLRKAKLDLRAAARLGFEGHQREAAPLYRAVYQRIVALPAAEIGPELRELQFECLYRLDRISWLLSPGEYDRAQMLEAGMALFEAGHTQPGGRYRREGYAQQIARYLRDKREPERALAVLNRALGELRTAAAEAPSIRAIEMTSVLTSEIAETQTALAQTEAAQATRRSVRGEIAEQFHARPRSRTLARQHLYHLFEQLDDAYWAKDAKAFGLIADEVEAITQRFAGSEANTFEAAAAQLQVKRASFAIDALGDAAGGATAARAALAAYGRIYAGQAAELPSFDNSSAAMGELKRAMDGLESEVAEPDRKPLRRQFGQELLSLSAPFLDCARTLGVLSNCQFIVVNATVGAAERLPTAPGTLAQHLPARRELFRSAAQSMAEKDAQQPASVAVTERASTEPLQQYCYVERAFGQALLDLRWAAEALPELNAAVALCEPWADQYDFDFYLRDALAGLLELKARALQTTGDPAQARATLAHCVAEDFAACYAPYAELLEQGIGGPKDPGQAAELRARLTSLKRFNVLVRKKGGSELTFPFYVYIGELSDKRKYQGIEDQAIWLERNRGFVIPQDVRDRFMRWEQIARENKLSFPDVVAHAYTLHEAQKEQAK